MPPQRPVSSAVTAAHLTNSDSYSHNDRLTTRPAPTDRLTKTETATKAKSCDTGMCSQGNQQTEHAQWREDKSDRLSNEPKDSSISSDSDSGVESALSSLIEITNQSTSDFEIMPTENAHQSASDLEANICTASPPPSLTKADDIAHEESKPLAVDDGIAAQPMHSHFACEGGDSDASTANLDIVADFHSPSPSLTQVPHCKEGGPSLSAKYIESSSPLVEANYSTCDTPSPKTRKTVHFATPLVTEVFFPTCENSKLLTANAASVTTTKTVNFATPPVHVRVTESIQSAGEEKKPLIANTAAKTKCFPTSHVAEGSVPTCEENKPLTVNTTSVAAANAVHFATPLVAEASTLSAGEQSKPLTAEAIHSPEENELLLVSGAAAKTFHFATPLTTEATLPADEQNKPLTSSDTDVTAIHSTSPPLTPPIHPVDVPHCEECTPEATNVSVASIDSDTDLPPLLEVTSSHPATTPASAALPICNRWTPDTIIAATVHFSPLPYSQSSYVSEWEESNSNTEVASTGSVESLPPLIGEDCKEHERDAPSARTSAQAPQQISSSDDDGDVEPDDCDDHDSDEEEEDEDERIARLFMNFCYHNKNKEKRKKSNKKKAPLVANNGITAATTQQSSTPPSAQAIFSAASEDSNTSADPFSSLPALSQTASTYPVGLENNLSAAFPGNAANIPSAHSFQTAYPLAAGDGFSSQSVTPPTRAAYPYLTYYATQQENTAYESQLTYPSQQENLPLVADSAVATALSPTFTRANCMLYPAGVESSPRYVENKSSAESADVAVNMDSLSLSLSKDTSQPASACENNPLAACTCITATVECLSPPLVQAAYKPSSSAYTAQTDIPLHDEKNNTSLPYTGTAAISIDDYIDNSNSLLMTDDTHTFTSCMNSSASLPYTGTATAYTDHDDSNSRLPTTDNTYTVCENESICSTSPPLTQVTSAYPACDDKEASSSPPYVPFVSTPCMISCTTSTSTTMFMPDDGDLHVHDCSRRRELLSRPLQRAIKARHSRSTFSFSAFTVSLRSCYRIASSPGFLRKTLKNGGSLGTRLLLYPITISCRV